MRVQRITPKEAEPIIKHGSVWPWIMDGSFEPEEWTPPSEKTLYLGVFDPHLVGCWIFEVMGSVHVHVHAALTQDCRGKDAIEAAKEAIRWLLNNTCVRRVTAPVSEPNKKAAHFVRSMGFELYGVNPCASVHMGLLCDVRLFGLTLRG